MCIVLARIRLTHPSWSEAIWKNDAFPKLIGGSNGWFASAINDKLKMWKVHQGGSLYKYEQRPDELEISGVDTRTLKATVDGRYLIGFGSKTFAIWEFPQIVQDTLI